MPATPAETSAIEHEIRVAARPETVFAYFTDPARMVQWMGAEATLDPRVGGVFRVAFQPSERVLEMGTPEERAELGEVPPVEPNAALGEFVEVDPPHRIVFTWGWENELFETPPQSTSVEVSFTSDGDETIVRLVHRRLPAVAVPFHRAGWQHYLARLALAAVGEDPGPDPLQAAATPRA